ncbi:MAG TPA: hypothetical protein PLF01_00470 [Alphaproteobacteria bacterium]|nr:hypothetical protein [Alphaproteobacteria bacterium]
MTNELDGQYQVSSTTSYQGPLEKKSDGITEIKNGQTSRRDKANCLWTSTFHIISDNEVEMISVADPSEADSDFSLTKPDGSPTREPVTYKAILKLSRKGDKIQMSGQIEYDNEITLLTMRKMS